MALGGEEHVRKPGPSGDLPQAERISRGAVRGALPRPGERPLLRALRLDRAGDLRRALRRRGDDGGHHVLLRAGRGARRGAAGRPAGAQPPDGLRPLLGGGQRHLLRPLAVRPQPRSARPAAGDHRRGHGGGRLRRPDRGPVRRADGPRAHPGHRRPAPPPGGGERLRGGPDACRAAHHWLLLTAASASRSSSRVFSASRLSKSFLPWTRAISTLTQFPLRYRESGTTVSPLSWVRPKSRSISRFLSSSRRTRSGSLFSRLPWLYGLMWTPTRKACPSLNST